MQRLPREFFGRNAPIVAPLLLNKVLVVGQSAGRITEVEAYTQDDPASHSFKGVTRRNAVMFGRAGHLYVYFTYGMHHCANVVTGVVDDGQAVLIRAVDPMSGVAAMVQRRGRSNHLSDGPGKLTQAFAIDLTLNGLDICDEAALPDDTTVGIFDDGLPPPDQPQVTPRIGIRAGVDTPWRWMAAAGITCRGRADT